MNRVRGIFYEKRHTPPPKHPTPFISMNLRTLFWLSVITGCLMAPIAQGQTFSFDGYKTSADSYLDANKKAVYFYNDHHPQSYGTQSDPIYQTYVRWGVGTDSSETTGTQYFFLYVETPIEVKNMIWGDVVTEQDVLDYNVHYTNHHDDLEIDQFDYKFATGSEKVAFEDSSGNTLFGSELDVNVDDGGKKSKGDTSTISSSFAVKTSLDYLLANGATQSNSDDANNTNNGTLAVDSTTTAMAFEYKFAFNETDNIALINSIDQIKYHLSPERGLYPTQVPEPSGALLLGIAATLGILRRKR
jgi:hypothetical protein